MMQTQWGEVMDILEEDAEVAKGNVCQWQHGLNDCYCGSGLSCRCCIDIAV